jgi:hypothetical protein
MSTRFAVLRKTGGGAGGVCEVAVTEGGVAACPEAVVADDAVADGAEVWATQMAERKARVAAGSRVKREWSME